MLLFCLGQSGKTSLIRRCISNKLKEVNARAIGISEERIIRAQRTVNTKDMKLKHVWHFQGIPGDQRNIRGARFHIVCYIMIRTMAFIWMRRRAIRGSRVKIRLAAGSIVD